MIGPRPRITLTLLSALIPLALPASALAAPPVPLAPACTQFGFPGSFALKQSNGFSVSFDSTGTTAKGKATQSDARTLTNEGRVSGSITGRDINVTIEWRDLHDKISTGVYVGTVDDAGIAHGTTFDKIVPGSTAKWDSIVPLACLTKPSTSPSPAPQRNPPAAPGPRPAPAALEPRGDVDSDGLLNEDETNVYSTNPRQADTDGDGADDGQEVFDGTDPLSRDH